MNAEQYLKQIQRLDARIWNTKKDIELWKERAEYGGTDFGSERVQSSSNKSRMENAIIKSLGLEDKLKNDMKKRQEIMSVLDRLSETHIEPYNVLYKIFVLGLSYSEITRETGKSLSWVRDNRKIGLIELEKILGDKK